MKVELRSISKKYEGNAFYTLENINLFIDDYDFCVILGPSGCGKSTLLRMIAGLNSITRGDLLFDSIRVNNLLPKDRNIAMVFQSYALYPHMNVFNNIAFGLKMAKERKDVINRRVYDVAKILNIENYLFKKPKDLSGGQRQRVALGRAIARKPKLFLMDEPLSNLDAKLREYMRTELVRIHRTLKTTTIYVTHDQLEAMTMASKIVLMHQQKIQQVGEPRELYEKPSNLFVAKFIGTPTMNIFEGIYSQGYFTSNDNQIRVRVDAQLEENQNIYLGVRSEDVIIDDNHYNLTCEIVNIELLGKEKEVKGIISDTNNIVITEKASYQNQYGNKIRCRFQNIHIFDGKTEMRLN